ncbi:Ribonuclease VapC19 [Tsuneonella dongtanensis]|uniref:Ribonuclease VapC19 n=1 Tax=Tsuneonella dongtanensis TaxID=692370 RepID=A0A1B2AGW9_9SPHN|nr:PIN domain-containing protein [Tsuneonella dongtanensis]ANY21358.1 Ribonuclease VapC19 [Tsuneonella dongtanensis]
MSGFSFDTNILIDALAGHEPAAAEIRRAVAFGSRAWISRMVWIEVLSKGTPAELKMAERLLSGFAIDEIDAEIGARAAALRRERSRLRAADAIILASALVRGRVLVSRNVKDFPANMPGIRVPYIL